MARIAIDFDNTLVELDTALYGAKDAINILREQGHEIIIHSCNRVDWIEQVLRDCDIRYDSIWDKKGKPVCHYYIDDRGIRFEGDWKETVALVDQLEEKRRLERP